MIRALSQLCLVVLAALSSACLEFKEQTMSYRYEKGADEIRIFQDYRGIFGADAKGKAGVPLSSEEQGQLESVLKGQRTFFFENWIFEYNREDFETFRAELKDPEKSEVAAADRPKIEKLLNLLIDNLSVANGTFYLDKDGKLCGAQSVTIGKCSEIVDALNDCTPIFLKDMADDANTEPADLEAISKFGKDREAKMLHLDGNLISVHWPMSRASYDKMFGAKSEDQAQVEEIRTAGIGIAWADEVTTFTLGKKDDEITSVTLNTNTSKSKYTPNAIAPARAQHTVQDKFDAAAAAKTFLLDKGTGK
ncbi:MAG: hypothetical protein ACI9UA_005843 [Pseudoalteromonas tetraodonis]|jgi:hypothetical protein